MNYAMRRRNDKQGGLPLAWGVEPLRPVGTDILGCRGTMTKLDRIESQVRELSPDELAAFREWFAAFDAEAWDRQLEADVHAGRLDKLASRALQHHAAGRSTKV